VSTEKQIYKKLTKIKIHPERVYYLQRTNRIFMKEYLIIILAFLLISCGRNYKLDNCICNYTVSVADNIVLNKEDVSAALSPVLKESGENSFSVEIIIFGYSSWKEVFSYSGNTPEDTNVKTYAGNISALVKIKEKKTLQKVLFLIANGNGKEEILQELAKEIQRAVCKN
jgi:hypothetical protein